MIVIGLQIMSLFQMNIFGGFALTIDIFTSQSVLVNSFEYCSLKISQCQKRNTHNSIKMCHVGPMYNQSPRWPHNTQILIKIYVNLVIVFVFGLPAVWKSPVNLNKQNKQKRNQSNVERNKNTRDLHAVEYGKDIGEHNRR